MEISMELVKTLREMTSAGISACKKALEEAKGDLNAAVEVLRKKGLAAAETKAGRATAQGWIGNYVHNGRRAVLVEVACESDFVAKNDLFQAFLKDLCMHVCAVEPPAAAVSKDSFPEALVAKEREVVRQSEDVLKKPENLREKIVDGKISRFLKERCLLEQPWIKDPQRSVGEILKELISKTGENIIIRRFVKWNLGE